MKRVLTALIVVMFAGAMLVIGNAALTSASIGQQIPRESKEQPKKLKLDTDSLDDKWGEVAFNHENHTIKTTVPTARRPAPASNVITPISRKKNLRRRWLLRKEMSFSPPTC